MAKNYTQQWEEKKSFSTVLIDTVDDTAIHADGTEPRQDANRVAQVHFSSAGTVLQPSPSGNTLSS